MGNVVDGKCCRWGIDTFFSGNNGARDLLRGLNYLSHQAESNDTHNDHDIKIFGSRLGQYFPYASKTQNSLKLAITKDSRYVLVLTYFSSHETSCKVSPN